MSKKSRRRRGRDTSDIANQRLLPDYSTTNVQRSVSRSITRSVIKAQGPEGLRLIEDRRTFYPEPHRPARSLRRAADATVTVRSVPSKAPTKVRPRADLFFAPEAFAFKSPRHVLICIRRKMRREVLHALRKAGKGGMRHPRRNAWSDVHCKR